MKFKNLKKCLMAHLLALTIASPAALAMPTGGEVVVGDVAGLNTANMTVNADSLVTWSDFSVAAGEIVNINLGDNAMVNYVTGGNESQLLGILNANGSGESLFMLVNPNGIITGANSQINADQMILSTLDLGKNPTGITDFEQLLTNNTLTLKTGSGKITIGKGSQLIATGGELHLIGNVIEIADDVVIKSLDSMASAIAAKDATLTFPEDDGAIRVSKVEAETGNTVTIGTADIDASEVLVAGGKVALDGTWLISEGAEPVTVVAAGSITGDESNLIVNASDGNKITMNNAHVDSTDEVSVIGGSIEIKDSAILGNSPEDVRVFAVNSVKETDFDTVATATDKNNIAITGSVLKTNNSVYNEPNITIFGGKVEINNSTINTFDGHEIEITSASRYEDSDTKEQTIVNATSANSVTINDSELISNGDVVVWGGKIELDGKTSIKSKDEVFLLASSNIVDSEDDRVDSIIKNAKVYNTNTITMGEDVTLSGQQNDGKNTPLAVGYAVIDKSGKIQSNMIINADGINAGGGTVINSPEPAPAPEPAPTPAPTPIEPDKAAEEVLKEKPSTENFGKYVAQQTDQSAEKAASIIKAVIENKDTTPAQKEAYVKEVINNNTALATEQTDTQNKLNSDAAAPAPVASSDTAASMDVASGSDAASGSDTVAAPAESGSSDGNSQSEDGNGKNN